MRKPFLQIERAATRWQSQGFYDWPLKAAFPQPLKSFHLIRPPRLIAQPPARLMRQCA
jgi:hypothetical protein